MTKLFTITFLCLAFLSCTAQNGIEKFETDDDGITVEKFESTNVDENRYNQNNSIYKVGRKFTFSYVYSDTSGVKFLMTKGNLNNQNMYDWTFEKMDKKDTNSVFQIILSVNSGLSPFIQQIPGYNQTVISYDFKLLSGDLLNFNEMTGLIENEKNIWIHPPRTNFFKILEINPFPYIKKPLIIGTRWAWRLKFGSHWADKRWLAWEGSNENIYNYEITGKIMLPSKLGNIDCFVISSNAKSKLGETKLTSYFNYQFGFVKLDYTNIDGSKTIIELEKME
ncbi:MAG: hypothetical protein ABUT20_23315 [Bacteroidota bacterium]